jgi:hypothetical protein
LVAWPHSLSCIIVASDQSHTNLISSS